MCTLSAGFLGITVNKNLKKGKATPESRFTSFDFVDTKNTKMAK